MNLRKVLEQLKEVNKLIKTPIPNVAENPFTKFVPKINNTIQLIKVVMCPSIIEEFALKKPLSIDLIRVFPFLSSSLTLSKIKIFASTAIPILRIKPAMPGRVIVTGINEYKARLKKP
tara:strand:+ start:244 stop:597 length:354 start_codon:yes stop_codon:yes gene_type:complete